MIATSPGHLLLLLLFLISWAFFIRDILPQRQRTSATTKKVDERLEAVLYPSNASNFEYDGAHGETAEGAPRLAQASMQFGARFDLMSERGLRTHIKYGEKWGYPNHFLRKDLIGKGEIAEGMYNKLLHIQNIMLNEMTKPFGNRVEWIV